MEAALTLTEILAIIMFGEAGILHDDAAALAVGHVFLNRSECDSFGDTPLEVAEGFNAFKVTHLSDVPDEYLYLAKILMLHSWKDDERLLDYTNGSLYIISHQDTHTLSHQDAYGGDRALWLRLQADWISKIRIIDEVVYALYAYKEFPGDIQCPATLPRIPK